MADPLDLIRNIGQLQLNAMDSLWPGTGLDHRNDDYSGGGQSPMLESNPLSGVSEMLLGPFGQSLATGQGLQIGPQYDGGQQAMSDLNSLRNSAAQNASSYQAQKQTAINKAYAEAAQKAKDQGKDVDQTMDAGSAWNGNPFTKKPPPTLPTSLYNVPGDKGSGNQAPSSSSGGPAGDIDASSAQMFAQSFAPYAKAAAAKLGIDPLWVTAMSASESNYGKANAAGHELFGVKALPGQPHTTLMTHEGQNGGTNMNQDFAAYDSNQASVDAWVDLIQNHYKGALNAKDLPTFVHGLHQGGYFTAGEGEYLGIVQGIMNRPDIQAGFKAAGNSPAQPAPENSGAPYQKNQYSQFGLGLSKAEAYAFCGPAAAMSLASYYGNNIPVEKVREAALAVGWSTNGMSGAQGESNMLNRLGIQTTTEGWNDARAQQLIQGGSPIVIDTPGHYFFADQYDPTRGYHVGQNGLDLIGGSEWMTPAQMAAFRVAGAPRTIIRKV